MGGNPKIPNIVESLTNQVKEGADVEEVVKEMRKSARETARKVAGGKSLKEEGPKKVGLSELINPSPKQQEFLDATKLHKYTLYGGAKGGGKSYILRWALVYWLVKWAKEGHTGVRVVLFCEDYPSLKDRQITKINTEFPRWLGKLVDSQINGMSFQLDDKFGGGVIALRNLDDPSKYASSEFAACAVDELTKNQKIVFDQLRSIMRWKGISDTKFMAGSNPGGPGHQWVRQLWIDREFDEGEPEPEQFYFVRALVHDNPHVAPEYVRSLGGLPPALKAAYLEGSWDLYEGQFFDEWRESRHVIERFEIPETWRRFRCIDHGRAKPTACLWGAIDHDGKIFIYREYYVAGVDADVNAQKIAEMSAGERYSFTVLDAACFSKHGTGESIAEIYERNGVTAFPSPKDRKAGWALLHEYLRWEGPDGPRIQFFSQCTNVIREIPALTHDERNMEDVDTSGSDHCLYPDTKILTKEFGWIEIRSLVGRTGHVMGVNGWERFRNVRKTRQNATLCRVRFEDQKEILCTPDHLFLLEDKRWCQAVDLGGKKCYSRDQWSQKRSAERYKNGMGNDIINAGSIFNGMGKGFIVRFGKRLMGLFLKDSISTIKTTTDQTILSRILSYCQKITTSLFTCKIRREERSQEGSCSIVVIPRQKSGTREKKEENGTGDIGETGLGRSCKKRFLLFVVNVKNLFSFRGYGEREQNFAEERATSVCCVGVEEVKEKSDVYCLTLDGFPAFLVEAGVFVHNCADALSYALQLLHEGKSQKPKDPTEALLLARNRKNRGFKEIRSMYQR